MQIILPHNCRIINTKTNEYDEFDVVCTILKEDKKIKRSLVLIPNCGEYWFDSKDLTPIKEIKIINGI